MRRLLSRAAWLILAVALATAESLRGDPPSEAQTARISALIEKLGHIDFAAREAAGKELSALGPAALPQLQQAANTKGDLEIRRRAQRLIIAIILASRTSRSTGMEMALVDPGEFQMGSPETEVGRRPDELLHRVRITRPFLLGKYEVTQAEFAAVMKSNPSWFAATGEGREKVAGIPTGRFPVERVTWFEAIEFCNRLSQLDRLPPYYQVDVTPGADDAKPNATVKILGGVGYRLPTEAEWETACRGGTQTRFHFGERSTGQESNVKATVSTGGYGTDVREVQLGRTARVGSYKPNGWGLYDMHGNVGEWCWDWYDKDYYARSPGDDPRGPESGLHRVLRGGSWLISDASCRSASRYFSTPDERAYIAGFRVARSP